MKRRKSCSSNIQVGLLNRDMVTSSRPRKDNVADPIGQDLLKQRLLSVLVLLMIFGLDRVDPYFRDLKLALCQTRGPR